jgi:hypothetical protein
MTSQTSEEPVACSRKMAEQAEAVALSIVQKVKGVHGRKPAPGSRTFGQDDVDLILHATKAYRKDVIEKNISGIPTHTSSKKIVALMMKCGGVHSACAKRIIGKPNGSKRSTDHVRYEIRKVIRDISNQ